MPSTPKTSAGVAPRGARGSQVPDRPLRGAARRVCGAAAWRPLAASDRCIRIGEVDLRAIRARGCAKLGGTRHRRWGCPARRGGEKSASGQRRLAPSADGDCVRPLRARRALVRSVRSRRGFRPSRRGLSHGKPSQASSPATANRGRAVTEPDAPDRERTTPVPTSRSSGEGGTEVVVRTDGGDQEPERIDLPEALPVLPLKNTVLFPFLLSPLLVNSARSKRLIEHVLLTPERLMLAVAVSRELEGSPGPDDVHRTGCVLRVVKMLKFPDDSYRLLVQGVTRAQIESFL